MWVKTDPRINARVVVAEIEKEVIDDEISKLNGTWVERLRKRESANTFKADWLSKHGQEPSDSDVKWHVLVQESLFLATARQWGLWRNNEYAMADHCFREGKHELAIFHSVMVISSDLVEAKFLYEDSPKEWVDIVSPGAQGLLFSIEHLDLSESDLKSIFSQALVAFKKTGQGLDLADSEPFEIFVKFQKSAK